MVSCLVSLVATTTLFLSSICDVIEQFVWNMGAKLPIILGMDKDSCLEMYKIRHQFYTKLVCQKPQIRLMAHQLGYLQRDITFSVVLNY